MSLKNEAVLVQCPVGIASMITEAQSCTIVLLQIFSSTGSGWVRQNPPQQWCLSNIIKGSNKTFPVMSSGLTWSSTSSQMCEGTLFPKQEKVDDPRPRLKIQDPRHTAGGQAQPQECVCLHGSLLQPLAQVSKCLVKC